ncbi:ATP-binding cassette domain-containing protein [Methylomonas methanica]|uniref:Sulfate-transporting ATPase., Polyamine-transporting ATPase n=1 Tax=Methylomonas methanica (strain DSM 25384 / MC09) TaxID=857087 RepID=F9ZWR5_METMM|nr:ATP-binding cassette domain-containing protein [Methylomonas methanica]AEG00912.1 Sulfate-transporting ATPase., Polyamine-transporting ATPase [Methylomonas methanica MC09]
MTAAANAGNTSPALNVLDVGKSFPAGGRRVTALQNVSLRLHGGVTALVGPDGAGKTTLLRLAAGLLLPDYGKVESFGMDTAEAGERLHRLIGYMPQRFGLYEDLSVLENLHLYADLHGMDSRERQQRFDELMRMTGLAKFNDRLAGRLSGGMKQKLGLACTLINRPRLLLLDEPSVGVDPVSRRELWRIIETLVREFAATVLLSTAYMDEAERCDHVILLDQGRILRQGSPAEFHALTEGRGFTLSSPMLSNRTVQQRAAALPGTIDAVVQGEAVRVILRAGTEPDWQAGFSEAEQLQCRSAAPRLEDAFITLLLEQRPPDKAPPPICLTAVDNTAPACAADQPAIIEVDAVDRWFGKFQAVKKLSFRVCQGEIFGLLGANGAGKTTTFRMLCGLLPASNGKLSVAGVDLRRAAAKARARLGYMSQKFSLYGQLSVRQNLEFFSHAYGLRHPHRQQRMEWALQQFDLQAFADTNSTDLALGYKQRLALACALMHEPAILFLDEPTSGIDPLARREFWTRINQLAGEGVTILVTTHFMEEAEYCDRLLIMREGDILAAGTPAEIKRLSSSRGQAPADSMEEAFIRLVETGEAAKQ